MHTGALALTPAAYRARIAELGLTQVQAGKLFGVTGRTGQTWAKHGPPKAVAMVLIAVCGPYVAMNGDRARLEWLSKRAG